SASSPRCLKPVVRPPSSIPHPSAAQHPRTNNVKSANTRTRKQEFGFNFSVQSCYSQPLETEGPKFPRRDGAHLQPPEARERSGHLYLTREASAAPGAPSGRRAIFYSVFICAFLRHSLKAPRSHASCRTARLPSGHSLPRVPRGRPVPSHHTPPEGRTHPKAGGQSRGIASILPPRSLRRRTKAGGEKRRERFPHAGARRASLASPGARPVPHGRTARTHPPPTPPGREVSGVGGRTAPCPRPALAPLPTHPPPPFSLSHRPRRRVGPNPRERRGSAAGPPGPADGAAARAGFTQGDVSGHSEGHSAANRPPSHKCRHTAARRTGAAAAASQGARHGCGRRCEGQPRAAPARP
ncbi:hypothetical protein CIB84_005888, partial [Bambusicola thoracicus]